MLISLKNKHTLQIDDFYFNCSIGKKGIIKKKIEGDLKTPVGTFSIEHLYYRRDRVSRPQTKLKCIPIQKYMGWCNDCLLYTSPSPRDLSTSRMPSSA